eukprot:gene22160-29226_t
MAFRLLGGNSKLLQFSSARHAPSRSVLVAASSDYSFATSVEDRRRGERPNRNDMKNEERRLSKVVRALTLMTSSQLEGVSHLMSNTIIESVGVAARLKGTNQGRRRQEAWVMKQIRDQTDEASLEKLLDAVDFSEKIGGIFVDPDILNLTELWREGLVSNDKVVMDEVCQAAVSSNLGVEPQRIRALARKAEEGVKENSVLMQQYSESMAAEARAVEEDPDSILTPALKVRVQGPKPNPALRELNKILKPLAEYTVKLRYSS